MSIEQLQKEIERLQQEVKDLEKRHHESAIWAFAWEDAAMDAAIKKVITFEQRDELLKYRDKHMELNGFGTEG